MKKYGFAIYALLVLVNCVGLAIYVIATIGCMPPPPPTTHPSTRSQPTVKSPWQQEILDLINAERTKVSLYPLVLSDELNQSSQFYAQDMAIAGQLTHNLLGVSLNRRLYRASIEFRVAGENIAIVPCNAQEIIASLMGSPNHRANILNSAYNQMGVGLYPSSCGRGAPCYWCQQFIRAPKRGLGTPHKPSIYLSGPLPQDD